jgi:hypothetical protein
MPAGRLRFLRLDRPLSGAAFSVCGIVLMAAKFALDGWVAHSRHIEWKFWSYFLWPGADVADVARMQSGDRWLAFELLLLALPFIAIGVVFTVRRLRTAGLPLWLVALFFVPFVNFALFVVLAAAPSAAPPPPAPPDSRAARYDADAARITAQSGLGRAAGIAWIATVPATIALGALGTLELERYGWGLFVALPFLQGLVSVALFTSKRWRAWGQCELVALGALAWTALALLLIAFEGFGCLLMALPIAFVLSLLCATVAYTFQNQLWSRRRTGALALALLALAPALMAAEAADRRPPPLRTVVTSIEIAAPPEEVWRAVVAFPPIGPPHGWPFAFGVAAPTSAEIDGSGVGAVRRCRFTTGDFVEPIDVWDAPHRLHFSVADQPPSMQEWSPYRIHPPHLEGFLVSRAGEFRIEPLAAGRTRLVGTTWYSNRMWPQPYWTLWSDAILHAIHRRVLGHIRALAERAVAGAPPR